MQRANRLVFTSMSQRPSHQRSYRGRRWWSWEKQERSSRRNETLHASELTHVLGTGASATVFVMQSKLFGRPVAVKVSHDTRMLEYEHALLVFLHNQGLVQQLFVPQLPLLEVEGSRGAKGLVLELHGPSLLNVWETSWSTEQLRRIARDLILQLANLEQVGCVHGDLKPDNVCLTSSLPMEGRHQTFGVCLVDYGLARIVVQRPEVSWPLTRASPAIRNQNVLWYRAPETLMLTSAASAAQHHGLSPAADIWSLACVLYELVTKRPLFRTHSDDYYLYRQQREIGCAEDKTASIESLLAQHARAPYPAEWSQLLGSMLILDPRFRPSARILGNAFGWLSR